MFSALDRKGEKKRLGLLSREALIKKFDADGELSPEERKQAMEAFRKEVPDDEEPKGGKKGEQAKDGKSKKKKGDKKKGSKPGKKVQGKKPKEKK